MLCSRCGEKNASIHVIEVGSGGPRSLHLCSSCAAEIGLMVGIDADKLEESLRAIIGEESSPEAESGQPAFESCPDCGFSLSGEEGSPALFGCERDFTLFRFPIQSLLHRRHGGKVHKGKRPASDGSAARKQQALRVLEKRLEEAVRAENFELAAEIRDRIRELT